LQEGELKSFRKNLSEAILRKDQPSNKNEHSGIVEPQRECSEKIKKLRIVKGGLNATKLIKEEAAQITT